MRFARLYTMIQGSLVWYLAQNFIQQLCYVIFTVESEHFAPAIVQIQNLRIVYMHLISNKVDVLQCNLNPT